MSPALKNVLAVAGGIIIGGIVNLLLVSIGPAIIPLPPGIDIMDPESLAANAGALQAKHFIFPYLAHAGGTLVGAYIASRFSAIKPNVMALIVGAFFLLGGIQAAQMIPAPTWFVVLDLVTAYIPMGVLGHWLARGRG